MPSSSAKMTRNRPSAWWLRTKCPIVRVAGQNQSGAWSQSGKLAIWAVKMRAYCMRAKTGPDARARAFFLLIPPSGPGWLWDVEHAHRRGLDGRRRQLAQLGRVGPARGHVERPREVCQVGAGGV